MRKCCRRTWHMLRKITPSPYETCEALWAGLPAVHHAGNTAPSRPFALAVPAPWATLPLDVALRSDLTSSEGPSLTLCKRATLPPHAFLQNSHTPTATPSPISTPLRGITVRLSFCFWPPYLESKPTKAETVHHAQPLYPQCREQGGPPHGAGAPEVSARRTEESLPAVYDWHTGAFRCAGRCPRAPVLKASPDAALRARPSPSRPPGAHPPASGSGSFRPRRSRPR